MKNRIVIRALALAMSLVMLSGEAMPVFAAENDEVVMEAAEEDDDDTEEDRVSEDRAVSDNETDTDDERASENETVSDDAVDEGEESVSENDVVSDNEVNQDEETEGGQQEGEEAEEDIVESSKPSGNPVATGSLGDNVTGSIYKDGNKAILYIDGTGSVVKTKFKDSTLKNYKVTDILFGGNVTTIDYSIFSEIKTLERLTISGSIISIGGSAFEKCSALKEIVFEKGNGSLAIGTSAFRYCTSLNNVILPARIADKIGSGGDMAIFYGCTSLTRAGMEDGAKIIPWYAFDSVTALKEVIIPSSVAEIGPRAFCNCKALKDLNIPASLKKIGFFAYSGTAVSELSIPGSVTSIGGDAFKECSSLKTVVFEKGNGRLDIEAGVFSKCTSLNNVILPARIADKIGSGTDMAIFYGCTSLTRAGMEDGAKYIPQYAFDSAAALKEVIIPSSVTEIGLRAFEYCKVLNQINIPSGVKTIAGCAFMGCTSLEKISIPDRVEVIDMNCFKGCSVLTEIKLPNKIKRINSYAFDGCVRLEKVYCNKSKNKINIITGGNEPLINAEWIKISGKEEPVTGELTLDGNKVNSLKAAFKQMTDKDKDYVITLSSDLRGEKNLTIPKSAKSVTINGNGHMVEITGTKLTSNVPLTLNNIKFRAVSKKGAASKFTINAKKDLTINTAIAFEAKSTSVRAGAKLSLNCGLSADKVSSKDLSIGAAGVLTAVKGCSISVKNLISGANGSSISLAEGFKPINLGGGAEGIIKINGVKVADGTQILKTSAKKLNEDTLKAVFDVSGIKTSTVSAHLYYYGSKACIFADAISFNGKTYGVWKTVVADMNAAQKEAKKNKTNAAFTVILKDNVNLMGKFLLPKKGYDSISIVSEGGHIRTMTFTSDITLTGNTSFYGIALKKVNKKGEQVKGKIKKGKYTLAGAGETF